MIIKISHLLEVNLWLVWQVPFHFAGGGPNPLSLKLSDSGQIPAEHQKSSNLPEDGLKWSLKILSTFEFHIST